MDRGFETLDRRGRRLVTVQPTRATVHHPPATRGLHSRHGRTMLAIRTRAIGNMSPSESNLHNARSDRVGEEYGADAGIGEAWFLRAMLLPVPGMREVFRRVYGFACCAVGEVIWGSGCGPWLGDVC